MELPAPPPAPPSPLASGIGTSLAGRVVTAPGAAGGGLAGVRVLLDGVEVATTDAVGRFAVRGLRPAGWRRMRLELPGGAPLEATLPFLLPGQSHLLEDLGPGPAAPFEVRVLGMDGLPVPGAAVAASRLAPTLFPELDPDWRAEDSAGPLPEDARATANAGGVARFPALPAGEWSFQAGAPGRPPSRPLRRRVGGGREGPAVLPLLLDEGMVLEGRVLDDATGEPVAEAPVRWTRILDCGRGHDQRFSGRTISGPDGAFRFPAAPAAPLILETGRPGAAFPGSALALDGALLERVDLHLPRGTALAGQCVQSGSGLPAGGVDLRVRVCLRAAGVLGSSTDHFARSGPDGRFLVPGIPEDALVLVAPVPRGAWVASEVEEAALPPGIPRRVAVAPSGAIVGTARDAGGRPSPSRFVTVRVARPMAEGLPVIVSIAARELSGPDGTFRIANVPPGIAMVTCDTTEDAPDADSPPPASVEVPAGGEARVEVTEREPPRPPPTGPQPDGFRGRVLGPGGSPVAGARL